MVQKKRIKFSRKCASAKDHSWDEPYILSADKGGISGLLKLMFADAEKGIGLESQAIRSLYLGSQTRERMLQNAIAHMREKAGCRRGTISQETCFLPAGVSEAVGSAPVIEWASGKSSSRKERDRQGPFMLRVFLFCSIGKGFFEGIIQEKEVEIWYRL